MIGWQTLNEPVTKDKIMSKSICPFNDLLKYIHAILFIDSKFQIKDL